jgi:hypothetical protein
VKHGAKIISRANQLGLMLNFMMVIDGSGSLYRAAELKSMELMF